MDKLSRKERKSYNRRHGTDREERVEREGAARSKNPKRGRSRGYPVWYRRHILDLLERGMEIPKSGS